MPSYKISDAEFDDLGPGTKIVHHPEAVADHTAPHFTRDDVLRFQGGYMIGDEPGALAEFVERWRSERSEDGERVRRRICVGLRALFPNATFEGIEPA